MTRKITLLVLLTALMMTGYDTYLASAHGRDVETHPQEGTGGIPCCP
jgi:hypothetical protein